MEKFIQIQINKNKECLALALKNNALLLENNELKIKNSEMVIENTHLKYMPGNIGYEEAKREFEDSLNK